MPKLPNAHLPTASTLVTVAVAISASLALPIAVGSAFAETTPLSEPFKFEFKYDTSEMNTTAGAERLLNRLRVEATRACVSDTRMPLETRVFAKRCIDETMRQAVSKIGSSTVAEAFAARNG